MEKQETGTAYAFFDCNASLDEVHQEVCDIKSCLPRDTQSKLELSLQTIPNFRRTSTDLDLLQAIDNVPLHPIYHSKARELKEAAANTPLSMKDLRYALTAKYTPGTNNDAGDALCFIMTGIYASYSDDSRFLGQIIGKSSNGEYGFWEND